MGRRGGRREGRREGRRKEEGRRSMGGVSRKDTHAYVMEVE